MLNLSRVLLLSLLAFSLPLGGCSIFSKEDPLAQAPDEPADKLYNEGLALQKRGDWKTAGDKFSEIVRISSYTEWGKKALLMAAYSYYIAKDYDACINNARRYVSQYPNSPDAAYAQYLMGSAHFDQIPDINRDQSRTEKALLVLMDVERRWPNSEYAKAARRKIDAARDNLAGREMQVGRFYLEQNQYIAAVNRFRVVVSQYQMTNQVEEALARLVECYMALGVTNEAQTAAAILGHNFPESQWYKDSFKLIASKGLAPREDKGSWISQAFKKVLRTQ